MLLLESDTEERLRLTEALEDAGLPVLGVSSIAEVERWPSGDVVITAADRFTMWWKKMGTSKLQDQWNLSRTLPPFCTKRRSSQKRRACA